MWDDEVDPVLDKRLAKMELAIIVGFIIGMAIGSVWT